MKENCRFFGNFNSVPLQALLGVPHVNKALYIKNNNEPETALVMDALWTIEAQKQKIACFNKIITIGMKYMEKKTKFSDIILYFTLLSELIF